MPTRTIDQAVRILEHKRDWLLAGIVLYIRAMVEQHQLSRLALLERALEHVQCTRRQLAQQGNVSHWRKVGSIEGVISAEIDYNRELIKCKA